jgi:hypothetical protein
LFLFIGENLVLLFFFIDKIVKIKIDIASATTPPSFDGIDRKMT